MQQSVNLGKVVPEKGVDYFTEADINEIKQGMQEQITSQNKIASDLVDDTNSTNKFTTTSEKATWNSKENAENKVTSLDENSTNTQYPSAKCVFDALTVLAEKESITEITNSVVNVGSLNAGIYRLTYSDGVAGPTLAYTQLGPGVLPLKTIATEGMGYLFVLGSNHFIYIDDYGEYISVDDVRDEHVLKFENSKNKTTTISSSSTNTEYPSARAVYNSLLDKQTKFTTSLTEDLYLEDGIPPTLETGTYSTGSYHVYINDTIFEPFNNSIFTFSIDEETLAPDVLYTFDSITGNVLSHIEYDNIENTYVYNSTTIMSTWNIDTAMPTHASNAKVPSTRLLKDYVSPTTLFDAPSGTASDVTLNYDVSNYSYVDIIYGEAKSGASNRSCTRVYPNIMSTTSLVVEYIDTGLEKIMEKINISGTTITIADCFYSLTTIDTYETSIEDATGDLLIYEVLGYK